MILERGAYLPVGALVDEETLPLNLRKSRYVCAPGEVPELVPTTLTQPEQDEEIGDSLNDSDAAEGLSSSESPSPPPPFPSRKRNP